VLANAVWKFLRPHTIRGTILGTTAVRPQLPSLVLFRWRRQLSWSVRSFAPLCRRGLCRPRCRIEFPERVAALPVLPRRSEGCARGGKPAVRRTSTATRTAAWAFTPPPLPQLHRTVSDNITVREW
jgi:hypothetical protein